VTDKQSVAPDEEEGVWCVTGGELSQQATIESFRSDGVENLTYNNPWAMEVERIWFEGQIVYAVESGEVELEFDEHRTAVGNKVAQEYQVVHAVELDEQGKLKEGTEPERVGGQYNIYDSVPGMENYSPLWQFNYVVVPRDYVANTIRSEAHCLESGYPIEKSTIVEN